MRVLALLLAMAGLPTPTPAQVARTGPDTVPVPGFLEALEVQPLVLTAGEGVRIAVEVTAWGRRVSPGATDPQGGQGRPWGYRLEVESPPPFLRNLRWEDGAEGSVPAGLRSSEAHLRFDVDPLPAGGPGSAELVLLVRAQDPGAVPGERRIVIPLELRTRPAAVVSAHPVRWEAQVEFAGVDDPEPFSRVLAEEPPLVFDGVWVFFTPAVDTLRDFSWRIVGPDEGVVTSGHFLREAEENSTRRAGPGAPGAFVAPLARGRVWSPGDRNRGAGPGTYRLETCGEYDVEAGVGGVFGAGAGLPPCLRWQEEGSFPVGARQLHFKGMVLEEGPAKVDDRWGDLALPPGVFQLLDPNRDPSSRLVRFRAEWYAPAGQAYVPPQPPVDWNSVAALEALVRERFPGGDLRQVITQGPEGGTRTVLAFRQELGGTLEVAFPELLDPLSDTLGTLAARLEVQGSGLVARDCYGVTLQNPTSPCTGLNALAPGVRFLAPRPSPAPPGRALAAEGGSPWGEPGPGEDEGWRLGSPWGRLESEGTAGDAVSVPAGPLRTFRLRWPRGRDEGAVPDLERSRFGALIRREEVLWYVPVEIRLGSATLHAFGIYGASPGPYEGPAPRVPDELLGSTADLLAAGAGTVGPPPGREVPMDTSGVARVGPPPLRPPADTLTGRATPPGVRPPGAVVPPDTATLPPVRPAPTTPMPDLLGRPAAGAVAELEALGVEVEVVVVDLAASPGDAFTVTRQAPGPGALVVVGERAILGIRGAFAKIVTVPDVSNRTQRDASATLRALGLTPVVVVARSPSGEAESERIIAQQPGAGARVAPGAVVTLRTFDRWVSPPEPVAPPPHTDPVPDPDQPLPDWRREQQCRAATGVPVTLMQEGRLQEALALLRTMQPTCREIVDPLITEAERRLNPTPPVAPPLTPPPVILPPPDPVTPDPAPFRQANPWILAERCPRSITLVDGTFIPLSSAEPQPKGVELGFACVYQLEPRPAPGAALLWDYSPVASEPGRHTLCQDRQEGAYLFSGRFEISVYVPESLLNHDQFRREFLRIGEDAGVAAPCRR